MNAAGQRAVQAAQLMICVVGSRTELGEGCGGGRGCRKRRSSKHGGRVDQLRRLLVLLL